MTIQKIVMMLLAVFGIYLFIGGCGRHPQESILTFGRPSDVTLDNTPTWRGLAVGDATRDDVLSVLGTPEKIWSFSNLEVFRYLPQGYEREIHDTNTYYKLILQDDVVQVILIEVWGYHYSELLDEVGDPERIIDYAAQHDVAVFPTRGIAAVLTGIPESYNVSYLQYYTPTSLEEYMKGWGQFHPEELPWPRVIPARVDLLGFAPGKTTREEVEGFLGQPDFEWVDEAGNRQIYYYHIPGTISTRFHRFIFQQSILTWMNVEIREDRYSIDDAVQNLGQVSTVIRLRYPADVAKPIQYYCWPEKGIVLVAAMKEDYHPIQSDVSAPDPNVRPNGADVVVAQVQFEPLSLDEFFEKELYRQITEEIGELY